MKEYNSLSNNKKYKMLFVCLGKVYVLQGYEPEVYSLNGFRVENERLDKGIYIVKVKTEEGIQTGKVVVR